MFVFVLVSRGLILSKAQRKIILIAYPTYYNITLRINNDRLELTACFCYHRIFRLQNELIAVIISVN